MATVDVYLEACKVGHLEKADFKHVFGYDSHAAEALSLSMPLRTESYSSQALHPLFQMNLPEGFLRQAIERMTLKQYGNDDLTMLALLGPNQIGRTGYALSGQPPLDPSADCPELSALLGSDDSLLFEQLFQQYSIRSGVAGVQPKVLMDLSDDASTDLGSRATLTLQPFIVKSWGSDYPQLACNEFIGLSLARYAGLDVANFYLSDNGKLLVSQRFDVAVGGEPLGFEDFCVLQGKGTREKYDASLESCTHTIRNFVSAELLRPALYDFFKLTLVNTLLQNGDAHLKNSGIIYSDLKDYRLGMQPRCDRKLAPIFDIVNTTAYLAQDTMALTLAGSKRWPKWKALNKFARQHCGLNGKDINRALSEVAAASVLVQPLLQQLSCQHEEFSAIAEHISELIKQPF